MSKLNEAVLKRICETLQNRVDVLEKSNADLSIKVETLNSLKESLLEDKAILGKSLTDLSKELDSEKKIGAIGIADRKRLSAAKADIERERDYLSEQCTKLSDELVALATEMAANTPDLPSGVPAPVQILPCPECESQTKEIARLKRNLKKIQSNCFDEFYTYMSEPIHLAAGGLATTSITITREADFYLTKLVSNANGPFKYTIKDSSNDRQWSNIPIPSSAGLGTADLPFILPKPRFIPRGSTITIELTDTSLCANEVQIGFHGYKTYYVEDLKATV